MPTYHVELLEGRSQELKKKLVDEVTRVTVETLGCSPEAVDIILVDVKRDNWATAGKFWSEPRP
ncbi:MAG: 4-oxalocrotonate tautomerase [Rhodoferax sp.]|jgi:4-oxalocrotonate tautomerase